MDIQVLIVVSLLAKYFSIHFFVDRPLPTTERSVRMDEILHEPRMSGALPVPKPPTQLSGCKRRKLEASATTSNKRHRGVNQQRERSETFSTDELSIAWENRHDAPNNRSEGSRMEGKSIGFSQTRFLWIPNDREDGGGYWLGMHDVADVFRQDLERKLFKSYQADPKREKLFHRMQNEPATYFAKGRCVNNVTYARKAMRCVDEGGNDKRACNQCSKAKRLCVRVVKHEDAYCFGIYPLGSAHRVGKSWDEMGFWLKDRTVKTTRKSTQ